MFHNLHAVMDDLCTWIKHTFCYMNFAEDISVYVSEPSKMYSAFPNPAEYMYIPVC